jgi:hypothetical protein
VEHFYTAQPTARTDNPIPEIFGINTSSQGNSNWIKPVPNLPGSYGHLTLTGGILFGTSTTFGVFAINAADGTNYHVISSQTVGAIGSLTLIGNTLFGETRSSLFSINTDGTGYHLLHTFSGAINDGTGPNVVHSDINLLQFGSSLIGTTAGTLNGHGSVFEINTDGTNYHLLYSFTGGANGDAPFGDLALAGSTIYGVLEGNGPNNAGVIYSLSLVPEPSSLALAGTGLIALLACTLRRKFCRSGLGLTETTKPIWLRSNGQSG